MGTTFVFSKKKFEADIRTKIQYCTNRLIDSIHGKGTLKLVLYKLETQMCDLLTINAGITLVRFIAYKAEIAILKWYQAFSG